MVPKFLPKGVPNASKKLQHILPVAGFAHGHRTNRQIREGRGVDQILRRHVVAVVLRVRDGAALHLGRGDVVTNTWATKHAVIIRQVTEARRDGLAQIAVRQVVDFVILSTQHLGCGQTLGARSTAIDHVLWSQPTILTKVLRLAQHIGHVSEIFDFLGVHHRVDVALHVGRAVQHVGDVLGDTVERDRVALGAEPRGLGVDVPIVSTSALLARRVASVASLVQVCPRNRFLDIGRENEAFCWF
mmetsp:Transcript_19869/g.34447  ORF Transcript_19869/g.34447 Transcript_19869/m.34447 type:complete len:244 (+) Transcript_19869:219-950(+)